jgi:hypothetical protein
MVLLDRLDDEQKARVGRQLCSGNLAREGQGKAHVAGADGFGQRLLGELNFARPSVGEGREKLGCTRMLPVDRSGSRLDIGERRIAG